MKNSNDTIGNRSRYLSVCSTVSQPLSNRVPRPKGNLVGKTLSLGEKILVPIIQN
jgi:hypothetical protein